MVMKFSQKVLRASLMLVILCVVWGMTFPATKIALKVTDPIHFIALRFSIASIILLPFYIWRFRQTTVHANSQIKLEHGLKGKSFWLRGFIIGLLLFSGFALQVFGMKWTTASRSGFFTGLTVIIVPIITWLFRKSKTHLFTWLGILPTIAGIGLLADIEAGGMNVGDWLTIICAFAFASQMVTLEALSTGERGEAWRLTFVQIVSIALIAVIWSFFTYETFAITGEGIIAAIYTGLFGSILAVWLQTRFQPEVPASHAALIFTLEPVFAALFANLMLGDAWSIKTMLGAALILIAMMVSGIGVGKSGNTSVREPV